MKTILLAAKYFALQDNAANIEMKHLLMALEGVEFVDTKTLKLIKNMLPNANISTKAFIKQEFIDRARSARRIDYDPDVKEFLEKLKIEGYDTSKVISKLMASNIVTSDAFERIKNIKEELYKEAFGQQLAVESISDGLMRAEYRQKEKAPKAAFLLAGPKSPIKTYIVDKLASLLPEYAYRVFKMSAYANHNGAMQLFGIPNPYAGAKEGLVTSFVKSNPTALLVFEDIELAHKDAFIHMAKILDEGVCVDSFSSETIDFSKSIIFFTTSAGKEIYSKHEFMMIAQNDQRSAESMIFDAISREERWSSHNGIELLFDPFFMNALRKSKVALFGKIGFSIYEYITKKALIEEFDNFERKMGIKISVDDLDMLTKLAILGSGPEFDIENIKEKMPAFILDIITDSIINNTGMPKKVTISISQKDRSFIDELVSSADDMKLLNELFRKNQSVNFKYTYDASTESLEFHTLTLDKVKRAKDYGDEGGFSIDVPNVKFSDIAGHHKVKERLQEVIRILKTKSLEKELGKHMPKGMLLYGPPGTGKTMLAKAFANEADLPFIAITGPDLLNERIMKDVFSRARDYAPAIVFIDEIDVFKHRGRGYGTDFLVNKLLTLIDGFSTNEEDRIFIIAATNFKENIDEAILRSGRIDLHILVDYLDKDARAWFIDRMLSRDIFDKKINREKLLKYTANMSGADLQKINSESILYASRKGIEKVTEEIVMEQINILKYGERIEDDELEVMLTRTAYHEAGHAVVSKILMPQQKIEQITVTPRSNALGFVSYENSNYQSHTKEWFENRICVSLAGRAAEVQKYGKEGVESGASRDLEIANSLAYHAIAELGMDERLRNICKRAFGQSEIFNTKIEEIVMDWIGKMSQRTDELIIQHWEKIEKLASLLIEKEVVEENELNTIISGT